MSHRRPSAAPPDDRSEKRFPTAAEISRAISAAQKLALPVVGYTVHPDGSITVQTAKSSDAPPPTNTDWHTLYG